MEKHSIKPACQLEAELCRSGGWRRDAAGGLLCAVPTGVARGGWEPSMLCSPTAVTAILQHMIAFARQY